MKPRQRGEPPFRIWNEYENEGQGKRRKRIFYLDLVKISLKKKNLSRKNFWEKKNKFQTQWSIHFHRSSVSFIPFSYFIRRMNYRKDWYRWTIDNWFIKTKISEILRYIQKKDGISFLFIWKNNNTNRKISHTSYLWITWNLV